MENGIIPFDYDAYFLKYYQSIQPTEIQDQMAHNLAYKELESQVEKAISGQKNFSYETNFNSTPLFWPQKFRDNGYEIHLIFHVFLICFLTVTWNLAWLIIIPVCVAGDMLDFLYWIPLKKQ